MKPDISFLNPATSERFAKLKNTVPKYSLIMISFDN
jgi:hypothetical protein